MRSNEIAVGDLWGASSLVCQGHELLRLEDNPVRLGFKNFIFRRTDEAAQDLNKFYRRELRLEPARLLNCCRRLARMAKGGDR